MTGDDARVEPEAVSSVEHLRNTRSVGRRSTERKNPRHQGGGFSQARY